MPLPPSKLAPHVNALEQFQRLAYADRFLVNTGQKATADPAPFQRYAYLADGRLVRDLLEEGQVAWARELIKYYFQARLLTATDRLREAERTVTANFRGTARTQAELVALSSGGVSQDERVVLNEALSSVRGQLSAEQVRWIGEYHKARAALGFPDHEAFVSAFYPGLEEWITGAAAWLDDSRGEFLTRWRAWRQRDGISTPAVSDMQGVATKVRVPPGAPPAVSAAGRSAADMGFDTSRVTVDAEVRPGKAPMAFCVPVAPPHDVRLSVYSARSMDSFVSTMHEFGHGIHFTSVPARPSDLWPADPAVVEGFGLLIELIAREPLWQRRYLGAELTDEQVDRLIFARDGVRRIVTASIRYEMAVLGGQVNAPDEYIRMFREEFEIEASPLDAFSRLRSYLAGQPCYPLVYYQAFLLRDRLWARLREEVGADWYSTPEAYRVLNSLFRQSEEADVASLLREPVRTRSRTTGV